MAETKVSFIMSVSWMRWVGKRLKEEWETQQHDRSLYLWYQIYGQSFQRSSLLRLIARVTRQIPDRFLSQSHGLPSRLQTNLILNTANLHFCINHTSLPIFRDVSPLCYMFRSYRVGDPGSNSQSQGYNATPHAQFARFAECWTVTTRVKADLLRGRHNGSWFRPRQFTIGIKSKFIFALAHQAECSGGESQTHEKWMRLCSANC